MWEKLGFDKYLRKVFSQATGTKVDAGLTSLELELGQNPKGSYSTLAERLDWLIPPGAQLPYGGDNAPAGWLLCDGAAVSRTSYARLFAAIGTKYGAGDGSTTFNVPDKRGRASVGRDAGQTEFDNVGERGGVKTGTTGVPNSSVWARNDAAQLSCVNSSHTHNYSTLQPYEVDNWIVRL